MGITIQSSRSPLTPRPAPQPTKTPVSEPVLLIHGTFANKYRHDKTDWWQSGSAFCTELDARLAENSSAARCWAGFTGHREIFAWTGSNLESERRSGGRSLAALLTDLENDPAVESYHLIAHSHGGNVVTNAMWELDQPPNKLGAVITMGTPVLSFSRGMSFNFPWLNWVAMTAVLTVGIWQFVIGTGDERAYLLVGIVAVLAAMFLEILRPLPSSQRCSLYGSGHAHALAFTEDEAISGLISANEIIRQPRKFLRQFLEAEKTVSFAVEPRSPPAGREWRSYQRTGAYVLMKLLCHTLANQNSASAQWIRNSSPHPMASGDAQSERAQKVASFIQLIPVPPLQWMALAVLIVCVSLPLLLTGFINLLVTLPKWLWGWCKYLLAAIAAGLAWVSLPSLMLKAAFGADRGFFVAVSKLPPDVSKLVPLNDAMLAESALLSKEFGSSAGASILRGIVSHDPFAIKSLIEAALTDSRMVHSHYYQSAEIRAVIAKLIANN